MGLQISYTSYCVMSTGLIERQGLKTIVFYGLMSYFLYQIKT